MNVNDVVKTSLLLHAGASDHFWAYPPPMTIQAHPPVSHRPAASRVTLTVGSIPIGGNEWTLVSANEVCFASGTQEADTQNMLSISSMPPGYIGAAIIPFLKAQGPQDQNCIRFFEQTRSTERGSASGFCQQKRVIKVMSLLLKRELRD